jgi:SAM-dependent methyltransferase
MDAGMADYERTLSPLKAALFGAGAADDISRVSLGAVMELGCGTGPSLRYFGGATRIVGVEPNTAMHPLAAAAAGDAGIADRFSLVTATGEALPFPDASFDTVVGACHALCDRVCAPFWRETKR